MEHIWVKLNKNVASFISGVSFYKMLFKMSSTKWRLFWTVPNVLSSQTHAVVLPKISTNTTPFTDSHLFTNLYPQCLNPCTKHPFETVSLINSISFSKYHCNVPQKWQTWASLEISQVVWSRKLLVTRAQISFKIHIWIAFECVVNLVVRKFCPIIILSVISMTKPCRTLYCSIKIMLIIKIWYITKERIMLNKSVHQ